MTKRELQQMSRVLVSQGAFAGPAILERGNTRESLRYLRRLYKRVKNDPRGEIIYRLIRKLEGKSRALHEAAP